MSTVQRRIECRKSPHLPKLRGYGRWATARPNMFNPIKVLRFLVDLIIKILKTGRRTESNNALQKNLHYSPTLTHISLPKVTYIRTSTGIFRKSENNTMPQNLFAY